MFNQFMKHITFLLVLFLFSCNNIDNNYKEARFSDFYNSNSNKLLIDVRTPEEFIEKRALESINIDFYDENFNDDILKISKEDDVYIYCRSGRRSELAVRFLLENGFENVYNVNSGIIKIDSIYLDFRTLNN